MSQITISGDTPLVIEPEKRRRAALSERDARSLTQEIQRTSVRLWVLVTEAHDRKAYTALGYPTWDDYVRAELKMSPSRSYQLLDTGHVMKELAVAGADIDAMPVIPTRVVAKVKDRLPEVRRLIRSTIASEGDLDRALRDLARQPRKGDSNGQVEESAVQAGAARMGRPPTMVVCPVCAGEGKVSRSLSAKALAWVRKREKAQEDQPDS